MTPSEEVALIVGGDLRYGSWSADKAAVIGAVTGRAADAALPFWARALLAQSMTNHGLVAKHLTWVACLLVTAAANPKIVRGAVIDQLVERFGEP